MTPGEQYVELMEQVDRLEVFLVIVITLFVISVLATAWLVFGVTEGDNETDE